MICTIKNKVHSKFRKNCEFLLSIINRIDNKKGVLSNYIYKLLIYFIIMVQIIKNSEYDYLQTFLNPALL